MIQFINPQTGNNLSYGIDKTCLVEDKTNVVFPIVENEIICFLNNNDSFYEASYLNNVKLIPKSEKWYHIWPLWIICNRYLWEVRKQFNPDSTLLELGCAGGVDYFGLRYHMIGLDLSKASLKIIKNYKYKIQANAMYIPLKDNSLDGIISSYFWEHIPTNIKKIMLQEFKRVLKPNGKMVFLYDVATENVLIKRIKEKDPDFYQKEFLDKDGHLGYSTPQENRSIFEEEGFSIIKHFGMERTIIQSSSVFEKLSRFNDIIGKFSKIYTRVLDNKYFNILHIVFVRIVDETIGRIFKEEKSRIILTTLKKH